METDRKIIVCIATSADGFIARPDGSIDWLTDFPPAKTDYGMAKFLESVDTIIWGRKTFELSYELGNGIADFPKGMKHFVFSRSLKKISRPGAVLLNEPIGPFVQRLRAESGKSIWMMGGGGIIASFLDAGGIDEFIIHAIPVFIGAGIPLIASGTRTVRLKLQNVTEYEDGVVGTNYRVVK